MPSRVSRSRGTPEQLLRILFLGTLCIFLVGAIHVLSLPAVQASFVRQGEALPALEGSFDCPAASQPDGGTAHDYLTCVYTGSHNARMTFYLYLPRGYTPQRRYPLVLVLQGSGERAQANQTAAQNRAAALDQQYVGVWGPGSPVGGPSIQQRWPSFVVVPQVVAPQRWVNVPGPQGTYAISQQPSASLSMAMTIVELLQQRYTSIDANRRYITGISMGAYGVWDAIERWPDYFAAAAPVAGGADPSLAGELVQLPIWDFHGAADSIVPVAASRAMIRALRAAGGHPCYTEYPGLDHVIWGQAYGLDASGTNPLMSWLFAQQRGTPEVATAACGAS